MQYLKIIGERIKNARMEKGVSVRELEKLTNDEASNLYKIEKGEMNLTFKRLQRIADALDLSIDLSFEPKQEIKAPEITK